MQAHRAAGMLACYPITHLALSLQHVPPPSIQVRFQKGVQAIPLELAMAAPPA